MTAIVDSNASSIDHLATIYNSLGIQADSILLHHLNQPLDFVSAEAMNSRFGCRAGQNGAVEEGSRGGRSKRLEPRMVRSTA